jgi:hypothetical protein
MKLLILSSFVILISSFAFAQTPGSQSPATAAPTVVTPTAAPAALPPIPFATPAPRNTPKPTLFADVTLTAAQVNAYLSAVASPGATLSSQIAALVPPSLGITLAQLKSFALYVTTDTSGNLVGWRMHIVYTH